ncbi:MAG: ECF-type sigma factor [Pseudomonadota bacterium]
MDGITQLVEAHREGDDAAYDHAMELLYSELRRVAHRIRKNIGGNPTLQTTAVVNEAYLKMRRSLGAAENSAHLLNIASRAMRQIIVDYARTRNADKRGGDMAHVELEESDAAIASEAEQVLLINEAIDKLAAHSQSLADVFELKFFTGLTDAELAAATGTSIRSAQRNWMKARAFVGDYLTSD